MLDKIKFKLIKEQDRPVDLHGEWINVVEIYINDECLLDKIVEVEKQQDSSPTCGYAHQTAIELYAHLINAFVPSTEEHDEGVDLYCCGGCGYSGCESPYIDISRDEKYVYWNNFRNHLEADFDFSFKFSRRQYEAELKRLKALREPNTWKPIIIDEVVFENDEYVVKHAWRHVSEEMYEDRENGMIHAQYKEPKMNDRECARIISREGENKCIFDLKHIDHFDNGMAIVKDADDLYGCAQVGQLLGVVIKCQYDSISPFENGQAIARKGDKWFILKESGEEIPIVPSGDNYETIYPYRDGMYMVSTLNMELLFCGEFTDFSPGILGYIDANGKEVIKPQYIFAREFCNGIAIVCRGEWTKDEKWKDQDSNCIWSEEMIWGGIDKEGNTVIPFIYDEIQVMENNPGLYLAHVGGWKEGKWGVIDEKGEWVVQPKLADVGAENGFGLVTFCDGNVDFDVPYGLFDITHDKILFEPQFSNIDILEENRFAVTIYDSDYDYPIEKIVDRKGNVIVGRDYNSIYTWMNPYQVEVITDEGKHGLVVDKQGNILIECEYPIRFGCVDGKSKRLIFEKGKYCGLMDFSGNILIPADKYKTLFGINDPFLTASKTYADVMRIVTFDDDYKPRKSYGLITDDGTDVLPRKYTEIKWLKDKTGVLCESNGYFDFYTVTRKENK